MNRLTPLVLVLALTPLAQCTCEDELAELYPDIVVTPEALTLGLGPLAGETPGVVQVGNVGDTTLVIHEVTLAPLEGADDTFIDATGAAFTLTAIPESVGKDELEEIRLNFVPVAEGKFGAEIVIKSDDPDEPEVRVPVTGEGGAALIEADPPELDFGVVSEGPGMQRTATLVNAGLAFLHITDITLESTTTGDPSIFSLTEGIALDRTVAVTGSTTVDVFAFPTTEAWIANGMMPFTDALLVTSNASNAPVLRVPIVADINRAPTAIAVELTSRLTEVKVSVGREVIIDGTESSDPEGEALSFAWTILSAPDPAALLVADPPGDPCTDDSVCETDEGYRCTVGPPMRCRQVAWTHLTPQLPGTYEVKLRVTDARGAWDEATVRILPRDLAVVLKWEPLPGSTCTQFTEAECDALPPAEQFCPCGQSDLDLHFLRPLSPSEPEAGLGDYGTCPVECEETIDVGGMSQIVNYCYEESDDHQATCRQSGADCAFANRFPEWGVAGRVDDPRLDVDDVRGYGPEVITLNSPADGSYFVVVHYCNDRIDDEPTVATVEIYVKGELAISAGPQLLVEGEAWYAANLVRTGGPEDGAWDITELAPVAVDVGIGLCNN